MRAMRPPLAAAPGAEAPDVPGVQVAVLGASVKEATAGKGEVGQGWRLR
jgi:hypothetical protein